MLPSHRPGFISFAFNEDTLNRVEQSKLKRDVVEFEEMAKDLASKLKRLRNIIYSIKTADGISQKINGMNCVFNV